MDGTGTWKQLPNLTIPVYVHIAELSGQSCVVYQYKFDTMEFLLYNLLFIMHRHIYIQFVERIFWDNVNCTHVAHGKYWDRGREKLTT